MAVDLGLPSGTKWANMNVGAKSPEDYGLYFAWGETQGYNTEEAVKRSFDRNSYKFGTSTSLTKYCLHSHYGNVDNKVSLDPEDDAATVNMGKNWRTPGTNEIQELLLNTTYGETKINGVWGLSFASKVNGNSIFLPAGGSNGFVSEEGCYWSSILNWSSSDKVNSAGAAVALEFNAGLAHMNNKMRCAGYNVRAVSN